jgi:Raf kinase inhibitor-like YbhB/YbcL family protein
MVKFKVICAIVSVVAGIFLTCFIFFVRTPGRPLILPNNMKNVENSNLDKGMKLASSRFFNYSGFPAEYTCDGKDINPPLSIAHVPAEAVSLALVLRDPDAPSGTFIHWVIWNIDPKTKTIEENSVPAGAIQGLTTDKRNYYVGPCPPSGTHRYVFTLYALDTGLSLNESTTVDQLEAAMENHIIKQTDLTAKYR